MRFFDEEGPYTGSTESHFGNIETRVHEFNRTINGTFIHKVLFSGNAETTSHPFFEMLSEQDPQSYISEPLTGRVSR